MSASREVDYDGRLATAYDAGRDLTPEAENTWRASVEPLVSSADVVIDVGAGTGRFARRLSAIGAGKVIAVEPAKGMRAASTSVAADAAIARLAGRAEALPVCSASTDVAWLGFVIHYLDLRPTGEELARALKRDGRVLVWSVFPDRFDDLAWLQWFPSARSIDEARMPTVTQVSEAWRPAGLHLRSRTLHPMLVAKDLAELAERVARRAISTLDIITDSEFEKGLSELREAASSAPREAVYSPHELLVFTK